MDVYNILYQVIAGLLIALIIFIFKKKPWEKGTRILWIYGVLIVVFFIGVEIIRNYKRYFIKDNVETLIHSNKWMAYDPSGFNPMIGKHPSKSSIEKDLKIIKGLGFDGVITFNCNDYMEVVPKLTKEHGLNIIIGIWNPNNKGEIANAIALQNYANGYCIGHNGLKNEYSFNDLKRTFKTIRNTTNKPISTTAPIKYYTKDKELINLVDWIFPDGNLTIPDSVNVERDVYDLVVLTKNLDKVNIENKPILLKMIIYPHDSVVNASEENQSLFYSKLLDCIKGNRCEMPSNVSISFYGLYDPYWKCVPPFYFWEPYTGLIDGNAKPRKALNTIMKKLN